MRYYLETNSLRQLANRLLNQDFCKDCYTSILSISELLSGIKNDREFTLRKSIFQKLIATNIEINLLYPESIRMNAFGFNHVFKDSQNVLNISKILIETDDYTSFQQELYKHGLNHLWDFLQTYDDNGSKELKNSIRQRISEDITDTKQLKKDFDNKWKNFNESYKKHYINEAVNYYAEKTMLINNTKNLNELLNSYDHSLDIFFLATLFYSGEKISNKNDAGKNDLFDLTHLTYLSNQDQIIVTDDKLIHRIMNKLLYKKNICNVNDI